MDINSKSSLYKWALALAVITVFYNLAEGFVSVLLGMDDETLALFGFGLDSFVEVLSGIGILHLVYRLIKHGEEKRDAFERTALRITGTAFYLLTGGLAVTAAINIYNGHNPETTFWGIVISAISIVTMKLLIHYKLKVGRGLNSQAIISDANCTKTCYYLSIILLISSGLYELTGIGYVDSAGALIIAYFAFSEGRESFEKARGSSHCGCGDDACNT